MNEADKNSVPCRYCRELINKKAKICRHCDKYTNRKLNSFMYFSTISSGIAILAAGIAYTAGQAWDFYSIRSKKDRVELVYLQTGFDDKSEIAIANFGGDSIFVHSITIYSSNGSNKTFLILKTIDKDKVETAGEDPSINHPIGYTYLGLPINYDPRYRKVITTIAVSPGRERDAACFHRIFYNVDNPNLKRMEEWHKKAGAFFLLEKEKATISYTSFIDKNAKEVDVDIETAFTRAPDQRCSEESVIAQIEKK